MERNFMVILLLVISSCAVLTTEPTKPPLILPHPVTFGSVSPPLTVTTCPAPSEHLIRCMREWACQYIIRLDLRCLLNLNGTPLLGGLLGGNGAGSTAGGGGGLLGNLLG